MNRALQLLLFLGLLLAISGCEKEVPEKYKRPEWLAGKLFSQIEQQENLSLFAACLVRTGYDTIINTSGSYTVFAPDNAAFAEFFQENPGYTSIESIPLAVLERLVKYHIVQNPWSTEQLRMLDVFGWIDSTDINNNKPRGFKRETLLREKDPKFGVSYDNKRVIITDTSKSTWHRRQTVDSRKFAPIFFKEYFSIYKLNLTDYSFYFNRNFDPGDLYFAGGKVTTKDIFAENGFIHVIDKVVNPLRNGYQILSDENGNNSYTDFLALVNNFPEFRYNQQKTFDQPGAEQGLEVDSLFDITYPDLAFDITSEKTKAPIGTQGLPSNVSIRYHHGLVAPTNEAMNAFINEYFLGNEKWGYVKDWPIHIKRIMVNSHMSVNPVYPTDFQTGFYNGEKDFIMVDPTTIIQKEYGTNCTFIGVDKVLVPRAFKSITGPLYLNRGYSTVMYAIESSGLLPALKRENNDYIFFVESDESLRSDSSLLYNPITEQFFAYQKGGAVAQQVSFSTSNVRTLLLNHVGTVAPKGVARKEFIPNLAGNTIIVNNETGEASGSAPTTIGFKGTTPQANQPVLISTNADNGKTYAIQNWFSFSSTSLFIYLSSNYPKFHGLLKKAGLTLDKEYRYNFISPNEFFTVFAPTDAALDAYQADTISNGALNNFLLCHFIQGELIFTDGNKPSNYYKTKRIDEKSTPFTTLYTQIYIKTGYDQITFPGANGEDFLAFEESSKTNIIISRSLDVGQVTIPNLLTTGVVHRIENVLLKEKLDCQ